MTKDDIRKALRKVRSAAEHGDNESAHAEEDALHLAVLEAIANGTCDDPRAAASEALKTQALSFSRWYA